MLLSAVYLQESPNSKYPALDPSLKLPLKLFVYCGAKFGFCDAGSLTCLLKTLLTNIYRDHYPECAHKILQSQLEDIKATLKDSHVDNLFIGSTLKDVQNELHKPSLFPDPDHDFPNLDLQQQSKILTISKMQKILSVLDFGGFSVKAIKSNSHFVQNTLNLYLRLA